MKLIGALLLACCLSVQAHVHAQRIDLKVSRAPLRDVFSLITKQTGTLFVYTEDELEGSLPVTIQITNGTLEDVLQKCFAHQPLTYTVVNNTVAVSRRPVLTSADTLRTIQGVVTASGKPLAGASVFIEQSKKGAVTDASGRFILSNVPDNAVIVFSCVGYQSRAIPSSSNTWLIADLQVQVGQLDETVVIAYGTTTRRNSTGSISKVGSEAFSNQPVSNPLLALDGRVTGMFLAPTSGVPGSQVRFTLRGLNSLRTDGNDPLFIVDGVPFPSSTLSPFLGGGAGQYLSPFNQLNASDIESIEILKDADATAIYGSRGANGVVLITTKKGQKGKTVLDIGTYAGIGNLPKKMKLLNTPQYLAMRHEAFANDGAAPSSTDYDLTKWDTTRYTDWQDVFLGGTAKINQVQASLSGGNENTQFRISGTYHKETTIFPGDFSDRKISTQFSLQHRSSNQRFSIGLTAGYLSGVNTLPEENFASYINFAPDAPPLYNANGQLNWANDTWTNPLALFQETHTNNNSNLSGNIDISYLIVKGLKIQVTAGYNKLASNDVTLAPKTMYSPSQQAFLENVSTLGNNSVETWIAEPQLRYDKKFKDHHINIVIGSTFQNTSQDNLALRGTGFSSPSLMKNMAAAADIHIIGVNKSLYRYNALFARINYDYKSRYIIDFTGRRDGSSRFGPGRQYANFGAAGATWIFTSESFVRDRFAWLSFGKLRASYGLTGSDQIGDYGYLDTYSSNSVIYDGVTGIAPSGLFNADYSWETNKKAEIALELGFLQDHIMITADYYRNLSSNQLVGIPLPVMTGFESVQANLPAAVRNKGTEIELTGKIINNSNFSWISSFNVSFPKNKLVSFPGIEFSSYSRTYVVGKSLFIRPLYHFTGIDKQKGIYQFDDLNKDGTITYPADITGLRERTQEYYGGWNNTWKFKSWQLDILTQFVKQTAYNYLTQFSMPGQFYGYYGNQPTEILSRWTKPGDVTDIQKFSQGYGDAFSSYLNNNYSSDHSLSDASFIRIKNVMLSYSLAPAVTHRWHLNGLQLYVQAQNFITFTHYKGYDPQANNPGATVVPQLRLLTAGFNLSL